jgi:beta-lactamase class A
LTRLVLWPVTLARQTLPVGALACHLEVTTLRGSAVLVCALLVGLGAASGQALTSGVAGTHLSRVEFLDRLPPDDRLAAIPPSCRPDPFAHDVASDLEAAYPGKLITAHVHDLRSGCSYSLNSENRQRTASVFKVMVMVGTLLEAQDEGRAVSDWEMSQLTPMITESANYPVRALWRSFGASPWFAAQAEAFGLDETRVSADGGSSWGLTTTSAEDQVDLLRQALLGEWGPLEGEYRKLATELMTSVVPAQTWGVTAGVPDDWRVAMKNGFAGITINSVGWMDEPGPSKGYVVAILSQGWPDHPTGIAAVERVSMLVAAVMTAPDNPNRFPRAMR